ncbi:MAG: hypothetical protein WD316_06220 [Phycisphaeraceae bacterium]
MSERHPLHAGFAKVNITPTEPQGLNLFGMPRQWPGARGVLDDLHARAMYLACGDSKFLLIVCDTVHPRTTHPHHLAVIEHLAAYGGIPRDRIWIVATHCHSAVGEEGRSNPHLRKVANRYRLTLMEKLRRLGEQVIDGAKPAKLGHGEAPVEDVGTSRRVKLDDGFVITGWGDGPSPPPGARIVGRGEHDPNVGVVMVRGLDDEPLGALVSYNSHVHAYPIVYFTSELAGAVCRGLERRFPGATALHTHGAGGDAALGENLEPQLPDPEAAAGQHRRVMRQMSRRVVDCIEGVVGQMRFSTQGRLTAGQVSPSIWNSVDGKIEEPIWAVAINDVALLGEAREMFVAYAQGLKARSPFRSTFVLGLRHTETGSGNSYFPPDHALEEGGYESKRWYEPGANDRMLDAATKLLTRLHREVSA